MPPAPRSTRTLIAHGVWESVLLLLCLGLLVPVLADLHGRGSIIAVQIALLGLPAVAIAASLRTGTVNLAVSGIAAGSSVLIAKLVATQDFSLTTASLLVLVVGLVVGVVVGAVVGLTRAPGWAVSLALLAVIVAITLGQGTRVFSIPSDAGGNTKTWMYLFATLTVVGSVAGGVLWLFAPVRAALGVGGSGDGVDPVASLGRRVLGGVGGFGLSTLLAVVAGVALVMYQRAGSLGSIGGLPLVALGIALFGGVSAFGGRGGIVGTVLAIVAAALFNILTLLHGWPVWSQYLTDAVLLAIGIAVSLALRAVAGNPVAAPPAAVTPGQWQPVPPPGFGPVPVPVPPAPAPPAPAAVGTAHVPPAPEPTWPPLPLTERIVPPAPVPPVSAPPTPASVPPASSAPPAPASIPPAPVASTTSAPPVSSAPPATSVLPVPLAPSTDVRPAPP
ncbi:MAG TPA: hypothetical protein VHA75_06535, partial [Rugosimonospora sp.]|nr:hypothetical protein [Rugosimonospora sp.]